MAKGKPHDPRIKSMAYVCFAEGFSAAEVAKRLGVPERTARSWCHEWRETPEFRQVQADVEYERVASVRRLFRIVGYKLTQKVMNDEFPVGQLGVLFGIAADKALKLEKLLEAKNIKLDSEIFKEMPDEYLNRVADGENPAEVIAEWKTEKARLKHAKKNGGSSNGGAGGESEASER